MNYISVKEDKVVVKNAGQLNHVKEIQESNDHVSLTFDQGQECLSTKTYRTRFDFFCTDHETYSENRYVLTQTGDACEVNFFIWFNFPGCQENIKPLKQNGCLVNIPEYEQTLNLSVLASKKGYETSSFIINICDGIENPNSKCQNGAVLCQKDSTIIGEVLLPKEFSKVAITNSLQKQMLWNDNFFR